MPKKRPLSYTLMDGEEQNRKYPETFEIPSLIERRNLQVGQLAKVFFVPNKLEKGMPNGERMWVEITKTSEQGYVGLLRNSPISIPRLRFGSIVRFEARHVIQLQDLTHLHQSAK